MAGETRSKRARPTSGGRTKAKLAGTGQTAPAPGSKAALAGTGSTAPNPPPRVKAKVRTKKAEHQAAVAALRGKIFHAPTKHTGFDPAGILKDVKRLASMDLGGSPVSHSNPVRELAASEAKNIVDVAKENYASDKLHLNTPPTAKQIRAAGAVTAFTLGDAGAASDAASAASDAAKVAEKIAGKGSAASKAAAKAKVEDLKSLPERVKAAPGKAARRVKAAPAKARRAVTTREGRIEAARGAGKAAKAHPIRSGYGAAAASPVPLPGELDKRARAAAVGTFDAVAHHPVETLKTTARALPAAIAAPAALVAAAGESVIHGTPKPLANTAKAQAQGVAEIAEHTFSGNPKEAELAARKEGSLAFLTPLPAISRFKPYERARDAVREKAGGVRARLAKKGDAANRSIRHSPDAQTLLAATGRREARKTTALIKQRADNPARVAAARHERQITKHIAKAPKGSHVALQTLAEYGIRDSKGAELVRAKGPGDKQLLKALDYVDQHPEVFKSEAFKKALQAVETAAKSAPAALVGKGERARLLQQGDLLGHTRPEQRVPSAARELTHATTREEAWNDLKRSEAKLRDLKRRGRQKLDQAKIAKGEQKAQLTQEGKALYSEARKIQNRNQKLYKALDPYTRPGHSIDSSARQPYDSKMLADYKREVEGSRKQAGLANAIYTHHSPASGDKGAGIENRFPTNAAGVEHVREGKYAKEDNLDRSLEGLIRGSVHLPRLRGAGKQFGRDFVKEFRTPFKIDGKSQIVGQGSKDWAAITRRKTKDNPNGGQFDPKSWARFPLREWKNAVKDPFTTEADLIALLHDAENGQVKGSEPWVLMPREAIKEARAQLNPEHGVITQGLNRLSRVANRAILGTNPAWAIAQTVAEGIPLLMAKPSLLNPVKLASIERDIHAYRKSHPEEASALQATAGASPVGGAALRTPLDMQETYTPQLWDKGARALTRGKTARSILSLAKLRALGEFDVRRQNEYRTVLAAAEADKRFRSWHSSLTNLFDSQARLSKRFKTRGDLWTWLTTDPKGKVELKKITDYVDNIQGNWTSFTRYERSLAPFTIFYPFLRYSLRWTLWTFPKEHPLRATVAYMLGQANANQLEKLVGGPLANPIAYAYPAYQNEKGETAVLPGGSRISPGQSSLTQVLATGNPEAILSSANPFIGAGIIGLTGTEPFTGEKTTLPKGEAALNALLAMPAPVRLSGGKLGGTSTASEAFAQYDPLKTYRSLLFPFLPQSGEKFAEAEKLGKAFSAKYGKNALPSLPAEFWEAAYNHDWKKAKQLRKEVAKAEHGSELVKAAEQPFFKDSEKPFDKEAGEILQYITHQLTIPVEPKKAKAKTNQFGIPSTSSDALRKQFGLQSTSASSLRKQFGLE